MFLLFLCSIHTIGPDAARASTDAPSMVVVVGAVGQAEYGSNFVQQASRWEKACGQGGCRGLVLGLDQGTNDLERLRKTLEAEPRDGAAPFWLVLIGHGTFDGKVARFNLRGPDLTADQLSTWLEPFRRPLVVVNTTACSAPFLSKLSRTNRVILTATRSGHEQSFARFGQFLAESIADPKADLDKDGQTSLFEAYLTASRQVSEFYKIEGRLATEHALLDDNADGLGTPADWFRGLRAVKKSKEGAVADGRLAHQFHLAPSLAERQLAPELRAQRAILEQSVEVLRERKEQIPAEDYYRRLEFLLLDLARLYEPHRSQHEPLAKP